MGTGEFQLIERVRRVLGAAVDARLIAGIGDDAAVWRTGGWTIATTDTMVDGVHFRRQGVQADAIGWKALAANVSDIAAMGGAPSFALVTLFLPQDVEPEWVEALYAGFRACGEAYGVTVAGGDVVAAPVLAVTVALCGEPVVFDASGAPLLLRRDAARAGDAIAVTGTLGGSAAGLRLLLRGDDGARAGLAERHRRPRPRVDAGEAAVRAGVRCGIDVSDGLLQDLGHICAASGLGATVRAGALPVDAAAAAAFPDEAIELAATGGEDYELVLIGPQAALDATSQALAAPLCVIGEMRGGDAGRDVQLVDDDGRELSFERRGWDHLARAKETR
ncbi:MAG: thiamine-phosphate kinase [Dehalococcoidia bacterium]|nr:thiamine-phosphate kinase [Dehalococcoidia bacterium]